MLYLTPVLYISLHRWSTYSDNTSTATFADDTAILAAVKDPAIASTKLQENINRIDEVTKLWKINQTMWTHITFTRRNKTCSNIQLDKVELPQKTEDKFLGYHLVRWLTWTKHSTAKLNQHKFKVKQMYWLFGPNSTISIKSKLLPNKALFKPIWTYSIQLWGIASISNIEINQRFQSKTLNHPECTLVHQ